ncbi:MAG TPA: Hsp20/alpha crystallin family protein, partial [Chloroflexota bacterium]|nr:Hsp20/alpha crystallin family protein [Chloroflexota bacterium]
MAYEISRRRSGGLGTGGDDPFREMVPLRAMMDRLFESAFTPAFFGRGGFGALGSGGLGLDVDEDDDHYFVSCHLPGIDPNDVQLQVQDNVLSISGETRRRVPENRRSVVQESSYGQFERQIALPAAVDADKAEAEYRDGILEIRIPKAEASKP